MMIGLVRRAVMTCLIVLTSLAPGYSQETNGTILGAVVDQTGGVLPGVKVVITSVDTGRVREVVTNNVGQYTAGLPVGNYEISFLLPKFQPFTARGISLHVNDRLQVNGKLIVGAVETLTVTAERLVQPTSDVRSLIQPSAVRELPLLTRTPIQLVTLVPGVSSDLREDTCFCDQGNLNVSINGARRSAVNWLLDGASNVNIWNNYTLVTTPSLEAIQEIGVITSTYAAEWARNGGGIVNVVTKSGTNRFSGSAYEFLRNDALNANSFFRNMADIRAGTSDPPRLRYNNFGYTLGGPALPTRKKLFFFFSEEWRRSTRDERPSGALVPDPRWLTDPASPNYVPPEARDPNAVKLLTLWPAPNVPGTNRYLSTITNALDTRQEFVRADYTFNDEWSLTGRYLRDRLDSLGEYVTGPDVAPGHRYQLGHLAVVDARYVRRRLLYEFSYQSSNQQLGRNDRVHTRDDVGILIPEYFPENAANLIPTIEVNGLSPIMGSVGGTLSGGPREYRNHTFSSALSFQKGSHALKTGALFGVEHVTSNLAEKGTQGLFRFQSAGGFTAFQNFLRGNSGGACGKPCTYRETDTDVINRFRSPSYEVYVQDTWRIHPKVTLDLGLRYAFYPPLTDDNNLLYTFSPDAYDPAQAPTFADPDAFYVVAGTGNLFNGIHVAGKDSPYGNALYAADTNNLQPRIGAAWDPSGLGRLVVRAGYGMYFQKTHVAMFAQNVQDPAAWPFSDPFRTDVSIENVSLSNPSGGPLANGCELLMGPQGVVTQSCPPWWTIPPQPFATSESFVAPRWQHWNLGVQRRLYSRGMIDLGYVGGASDHLLRYVDVNKAQAENQGGPANLVRPFLGYENIFMRETTAKSRYHGLVTSFRHEAGRGGIATVNYTFSRNKADATYDNSPVDNPQNLLDKDAEFAAAITDRTHIFTTSYVYELPFARETTEGWRKGLLGGWQIAGITRIESGPAVRIQVPDCNYGGWCVNGSLRPNQVGDPGAGEQDGRLWFNPAAFVPPPPREYGSAPVAPFRLPGRHQWDFAVSKTVSLVSTMRLQFRADLINAFNQTQFLDVNTVCFPRSGTTTCPDDPRNGFGQVTSARPPREIQLGIRLDW
jgi:Carboxypeptidase regulatory-like domain